MTRTRPLTKRTARVSRSTLEVSDGSVSLPFSCAICLMCCCQQRSTWSACLATNATSIVPTAASATTEPANATVSKAAGAQPVSTSAMREAVVRALFLPPMARTFRTYTATKLPQDHRGCVSKRHYCVLLSSVGERYKSWRNHSSNVGKKETVDH